VGTDGLEELRFAMKSTKPIRWKISNYIYQGGANKLHL